MLMQAEWETIPFRHLGGRHRDHLSEADVRVDLKAMLNSLDRDSETSRTARQETLSEKRKRKFVHLALPVGLVTCLLFLFNVYYLAATGVVMTSQGEVGDFITKIPVLETAIGKLTQELGMRVGQPIFHSCRDRCKSRIHDETNVAILQVLRFNKLLEWKTMNSIASHRHKMKNFNGIPGESNFYYNVMLDIKQAVYEQSAQLNALPYWKRLILYEAIDAEKLSSDLTAVVISAVCGQNEQSRTLMNGFVSFPVYSLQLERLARNSDELFKNFSHMIENATTTSISHDSCVDTLSQLHSVSAAKHEEKTRIFQSIEAEHQSRFQQNMWLFCSILIGCAMVVTATVAFALILKDECSMLTDVLQGLQQATQVYLEQKACTDDVTAMVVPRALLCDRVDVAKLSKSLTYQITEATLFTSSIAHYDRICKMFNTPQVVQILTSVMGLLDDRMAQYNVFTVTRTADKQIVMSNLQEKQSDNHAVSVANMALDINACCSDLEVGRENKFKLQLKIAIHTGNFAGLLSPRCDRLHFSIAGNALRTLHKLHRTTLPNRIHISEATYQILAKTEFYRLLPRESLGVQGIGNQCSYWLNGRRVSVAVVKETPSFRSRVGPWIQLERKPLYRMDELDGTYRPIDGSYRRYSMQTWGSLESYNPIHSGDEDGPVDGT